MQPPNAVAPEAPLSQEEFQRALATAAQVQLEFEQAIKDANRLAEKWAAQPAYHRGGIRLGVQRSQ